ncbi:LamG domain-containing protein [Candidatus Poribacteria bacterium]|nr:LamG domain-containing protein [Candidatus Poribacteria bacterium]
MYEKMIFILTLSICALFLTVLSVNAQFPEDGVVGYWPFDDGTINGNTVQDVLGENDGTLDGNPKSVAGKVGKGLEFDSDNFVHIPGTDSLNFNGKEAMTVAAWINGDSDSPVDGAVPGVCCGTIVAQRDVDGWALRFDGRNAASELEFITQPAWQGDGGFGVAAQPKGEWHHLVGVVDGKQKFLYLDGKLAKEGNFNGPMSTGGTETEIGSAQKDGGFIGIIDEVVIYNRALSEKEVEQLFAAEGLPVQPQGKLAIQWGQIKSSF